MKPIITFVVAMNKHNIIGKDNKLPWHIPEDLKHFKQITFGKTIIMGRKTFESIGRALPGRTNIVITHDLNWQHSSVKVFNSIEKALTYVELEKEICIIGGGEIFKQLFPIADKLYITIVDVEVDKSSAVFPQIDYKKWHIVKQQELISENKIKCCFIEYQRLNTSETTQ